MSKPLLSSYKCMSRCDSHCFSNEMHLYRVLPPFGGRWIWTWGSAPWLSNGMTLRE